MKLRLGQKVNANDGHFGELADIVVDPDAGAVTYIVVQPEHQHYQARLVPIRLVTEESDALTVDLDTAHLRRLEGVAESDYVKMGEDVDLGPDWDIGTQDVLAMPYSSMELDLDLFGDEMVINYDRVPKGDCEIRRSSEVVAGDGEPLGVVHGFLTDDDHITAIVVRAGMPGFRHDVLVPLGVVDRVRTDRIEVTIDEAEFRRLPRTEVMGGPDQLGTHISDLRRRAETMAGKLADKSSSLAASAAQRFRDGSSDS